MTADLARLRNRIPWIASQMRDSGMYTQSSEIESILPLLAELEQLRAERDRYRDDAERYRFLKTRLEVPGAVAQFLRLNNWHPDTDLRDVDAAIDAAKFTYEGENQAT